MLWPWTGSFSEYDYWFSITVAHKPNSIWKAAQSLFMNPENATEQILYAILKTLCSLYVLLFDEILVYSTELIFQQCNGGKQGKNGAR